MKVFEFKLVIEINISFCHSSLPVQGKCSGSSQHPVPPQLRYQSRRLHTTPVSKTASGSGVVQLPPILLQSKLQDVHNTCLHQKSNLYDGATQRFGYSHTSPALRKETGISSSLCYPRTTAREVGWRSGDIRKLEKYGRHARGQQGIRKLLNWPQEAIL